MEAGCIELTKAKGLPRNAKLHDVGDIDASFDDFGFVDRLIINQTTGHLVGGHGRIEALVKRKKEGKEPPGGIVMMADGEWQVPCDWIECEAAKEDALALRLNISQMRGGEFDLEATLKQFDGAMLYDVLQESGAALAGLNDEALKVLAAQLYPPKVDDVVPQIDRAAELQKKWNTARGQVWKLGEHRLMCGDSTSKEDVEKLMGGERAKLFATDPPYGIDYSQAGSNTSAVNGIWDDIAFDDLKDEKLQEFLTSVFKLWADIALERNAAWYLWHAHLTQGFFAAAAAAAADVILSRQIIWAKPQLILGRGDYHWKHEPCFYGWRKGHRPPFYGERNQTTVWEIGYEGTRNKSDAKLHPTQKPTGIFDAPMLNHVRVGEICAEPFSGSGSQIIAGERNNRRVFAMELEPKYVAVALERWSVATGKTPELMADGG